LYPIIKIYKYSAGKREYPLLPYIFNIEFPIKVKNKKIKKQKNKKQKNKKQKNKKQKNKKQKNKK